MPSFAQRPDQRSIVKATVPGHRCATRRAGTQLVQDDLSLQRIAALRAAAEKAEAAAVSAAVFASSVVEWRRGSKVPRASERCIANTKPVQVFSICPAPELLINTAEFWEDGRIRPGVSPDAPHDER